jgi:hypothetical protein
MKSGDDASGQAISRLRRKAVPACSSAIIRVRTLGTVEARTEVAGDTRALTQGDRDIAGTCDLQRHSADLVTKHS